jgi:translation initiation factor IF-3
MRGRVGSNGGGEEISADTCQVRLIVDRGRLANNEGNGTESNIKSGKSSSNIKIEEEMNEEIDVDDDESGADECDTDEQEEEEEDATLISPTKSSPSSSSSSSSQSSEVTTLNHAITIAHEYELDLMEVTLQVYPPVIKAVNYDKYVYEQRRKQSKAISSKKKKGGGGAISDRPTKEYKFRAGIADHDLKRKTRDMIEYLEAGHAVRVTLTARQRSLNEDGNAITTTLERVKELLGDKAVEARGMRANDRNSHGSLLFHPSTKK